MEQIADAVAILLDEIDAYGPDITDPVLTEQIAKVRAQLEGLQIALESLVN
jgi:hypothetical protein